MRTVNDVLVLSESLNALNPSSVMPLTIHWQRGKWKEYASSFISCVLHAKLRFFREQFFKSGHKTWTPPFPIPLSLERVSFMDTILIKLFLQLILRFVSVVFSQSVLNNTLTPFFPISLSVRTHHLVFDWIWMLYVLTL